MPDTQSRRSRSLKATGITLFAVATVSASGYFMGLRQNLRETGVVVRAGVVAPDASAKPYHPVADVPSYQSMAGGSWHPSAGWETRLTPGTLPRPDVMDAAAGRADAVARRAERRAYDGAPPVVPHPIHQTTPAACAVCHTEPTRIGDAIAPAMSHQAYPSCTQCHVSSMGLGGALASAPLPPGQPPAGNQFAGKASPGPGTRAGPGAPPVMPHGLQMRDNCLSCHGPTAGSGPATTHPERPNCLQCHATDGKNDFPLVLDFLENLRPPLPKNP